MTLETHPPANRSWRPAGAVVATRHGRPVVLHYGSAAGELARCVRGVGLADRSDLCILALGGPAGPLDELTARAAGRTLATGETAYVAGSWWCRAASAEAIAVCDGQTAERLRRVLHGSARSTPGVAVEDRSESLVAIGLAGSTVPAVLAGLGIAGADAAAPRCGHTPLAGAEAFWLRESAHGALVLVRRADAERTWHAIERIGRPLGIGYVGREALDRYALLDRRERLAGARAG